MVQAPENRVLEYLNSILQKWAWNFFSTFSKLKIKNIPIYKISGTHHPITNNADRISLTSTLNLCVKIVPHYLLAAAVQTGLEILLTSSSFRPTGLYYIQTDGS